MSARLYSTHEVAEVLGADPAAVQAWVRDGSLPCERPAAGEVGIPERGLIQFIKGRGMDLATVVAVAVLRRRDPPEAEPGAPAKGQAGPH